MKKNKIVILVVLGLSFQLDAVRDSRVHAKNSSDDVQESTNVQQPKQIGKKGDNKQDQKNKQKQNDFIPQRATKKTAAKLKEKKMVEENSNNNENKKREGRLGKKDAGDGLKERRAVKQAKKDEQKKEEKKPEPFTQKKVSFLDGKVQKIKAHKKELEEKLQNTTEPEVRPGRHGNSPVKTVKHKIDKINGDLQTAKAKHQEAVKDHEEVKKESLPYLKAKDTVLGKKRENVEQKKKDLRQRKDSLISQKKMNRQELRQDKEAHEALLLQLRQAKTNNDKPTIKQLKEQLGHTDHDGIVLVDKQIKDSKEQAAALRKEHKKNDKKLKNAGENPRKIRHDKDLEDQVLTGDIKPRLLTNTHKELNAKADKLGVDGIPAARLN